MTQEIIGQHDNDAAGNPAGGQTTGVGIDIIWQNGPLGRDGDRLVPNGAFVEGVIAAAADRIRYYQRSKFQCWENARALDLLEAALSILDFRTKQREAQKVEGTHAVHA
jgi:hypothetical protein